MERSGGAISGSVNQSGSVIPLREKPAEMPARRPVESTKKSAQISVATQSANIAGTIRNINNDDVSISENGSIDLTLFNYLDKGGDAGKALAGGGFENKAFAPTPNFAGISLTRYNQMKSEIEQNFASDPEVMARYLQELNKALDDYIALQAKLAEQLPNSEETESEGETEDNPGVAGETAELKQLYQVGSKEVKAIINKAIGNSEGNYPKEISEAVDNLFIGAYRQRTDTSKNGEGSGQKIQQIWNSIRLHIDSED